MKKSIWFVLLMVSYAWSCTGDCMSCHQTLMKNIDKDTHHKPMMDCIQCHSANPESMAECGADCFACHSIDKIEKPGIKEHNVIRQCRDCHMKMKEDIFSLPMGSDQHSMKPLKDFLLN